MTGQTATQDWRHRAACIDEDSELFFPIGNGGGAAYQTRGAKAVCGGCEVREECLTWALDTGQDHGIWGGLTEEERRSMKRRQQRQDRPAKPPNLRPQGGGNEAPYAWREVHNLVRDGVPYGEWPSRLGTTYNALVKRLDRHGRRDLAREVERAGRRTGAM